LPAQIEKRWHFLQPLLTAHEAFIANRFTAVEPPRLNLRPHVRLLPSAHALSHPWHQIDKPFFLTPRGITEILQSRPAHLDPRVLAQSERVAGNGFQAASSTRTSLGVLALQGLASLTLRRISPVAPFTRLAVPLRPWLTSQGIHRWANRLSQFLNSCEPSP